MGIGAVVLIHIVVGYAVVTGLARKVVDVVRQPLETKIIEEVKPPPPDTPPPPPPKLEVPPPAFVPPPEVTIAAPTTAGPAITTTNVAPPPTAPIAAAPAPVQVRVPPKVDFNRDCERPTYPPAASRAEVTGTVVVAAYVDTTGRVTQSRIDRSSGPSAEHKLLDKAAQEAIVRSCRFKPGTVDGKPEPLWTQVEYVWRLE